MRGGARRGRGQRTARHRSAGSAGRASAASASRAPEGERVPAQTPPPDVLGAVRPALERHRYLVILALGTREVAARRVRRHDDRTAVANDRDRGTIGGAERDPPAALAPEPVRRNDDGDDLVVV